MKINPGPVRTLISWIAWPTLLGLCLLLTGFGFTVDAPVIFFNLAFISLAVVLYLLECAMPHEDSWNNPDGQTFANISHTLMSKGTVQMLVVFSGAIGLASLVTSVTDDGYGVWPRQLPLWLQVMAGIVIAEFGLYWAHRAAHEIPLLWRFHALHHSPTRLWIINAGRFHFVDSVISIAFGVTFLLLLGAPLEVLIWLSAVTALQGLLAHCNVEMRFGPLSWIFTTPGLHRWHHSRRKEEGNRNYGENLVIWDLVFGTYYNPDRRPPANVGIDEAIPVRFTEQLVWPFRTNRKHGVRTPEESA